MELIAEKRQETGKKVKHIKRAGKVPAVVFGKGMESENVSVNAVAFRKVFAEVGETNLVDVKIDSKNYKVLIRDIQHDPVSDKVIHIGFYKPDLTETVEVQVPIEIIGEENNELINSGQAVALTILQEITTKALPTELIDKFVVDVSNMTEIGEGITVAELNYDKEKIEIIGVDETETAVRLDYATMVEEEEEEVSEEELIEGIEATEESAESAEEGEEAGEKKETKKEETTE